MGIGGVTKTGNPPSFGGITLSTFINQTPSLFRVFFLSSFLCLQLLREEVASAREERDQLEEEVRDLQTKDNLLVCVI